MDPILTLRYFILLPVAHKGIQAFGLPSLSFQSPNTNSPNNPLHPARKSDKVD
jgi:hypothetical protein